MDRAPVTKKGADRLKEELNELKSVIRPQIVEAIATAREHGDLKENAEYHAAREQQSVNEGRIQQLEGYGILAFKPSSELASGEKGFYDTRVAYVSFHEHIDARPEFIAWVDLTEGSVLKSREDKL